MTLITNYILPVFVIASDMPGIRISFHPVGTPEFMGPPKIGQPGFVSPIAEVIVTPRKAACLANKTGEYEILIEANGSVGSIVSHTKPIHGDKCERDCLFPYIMRWKFKPATFEGKATPVSEWVGVNL